MQQECIQVGCVPPARYRILGLCLGGLCLERGLCPGGSPWTETLQTETETPLVDTQTPVKT